MKVDFLLGIIFHIGIILKLISFSSNDAVLLTSNEKMLFGFKIKISVNG